MQKKNLWIGLAGFLGVVILSGMLFILLVPHSWLTSMIGAKASARLDREFAVDGDIKIDWNWRIPHIHLEKVRIANLSGSADPQMVEIESLDFQIKIWNLLKGELNLPNIKIVRPQIILEKNADGEKNWDFHAVSKANAVTSAALPTSRFNFPMIGLLTIEQGILVFKDATKDLSLTLSIDTATGAGSGGELFKLQGQGKVQNKDFGLQAEGGSLDMLRNSNEAYPLDLKIDIGKTKVSVKGTFTDPIKMADVDARLDIRGDNLADLFYLTLIPLPPSPSYSLAGHLTKKGEVWTFADFKGVVGQSDMVGHLDYDTTHERGFVRAQLNSNLLRMEDLSGLIGVKPDSQKASSQSDRLLPDMQLNLSRLRATDLDITLKAKKLDQPGWPFDDLDVRFNLYDGVLRLEPLSFGVAQGKVSGMIILDGRQEIPKVESDLLVRRLSFKPFFEDSRFEPFAAGYFGGRFKLRGDGKSLAEVLGTGDGTVTLMMTRGAISKLIVDAAGLDLGKAAPALLGKDQATQIRCAVGDFDVKAGQMKSNVFVFDTTASNIHGEAAINLKDETINARIEAQPKEASVSAHTSILITGRLKSPAIGPDPAELGGRGVAAAALSFLGPVAALIPFIDLGLGEDSDCRDLIQQARSHSGTNPPSN